MPDAVIIPFELKDVPAAVRNAMKMADALDRIAASADKATMAMMRLGIVAQRLGSIKALPSGSGGGSGGGAGGGNRGGAASGPASRLAQAQANYARHGNGPDPNAAFDAAYRLQQAQNAMQRAQAGPQSKLMRAISSTRVGSNGNGGVSVMPLVGAVGSAFGPEGMAVAAAIGVEVAELTAAMKALQQMTGHANRATALAFDSGSTASVAKLGGLAAGLGFDEKSASSSFLENMGSRAGRYYAVQAGINPWHNEFGAGNQDGAGSASKFLKYYGDPTKSQELDARMAGRAFGMSDQIAVTRAASPEVRSKFFAYQQEQETPQAKTAAANAQLLLGMSMGRVEAIATKIANNVLPPFAKYLEDMYPSFVDLSKEFENITPSLETAGKWLAIYHTELLRVAKIFLDLGTGNYKNLANDMKHLFDPVGQDKTAKAASDIKEAAKDIKNAADAFTDGVYGSGSARARSATPGIGPNYDDHQYRQAVATGAVTF